MQLKHLVKPHEFDLFYNMIIIIIMIYDILKKLALTATIFNWQHDLTVSHWQRAFKGSFLLL